MSKLVFIIDDVVWAYDEYVKRACWKIILDIILIAEQGFSTHAMLFVLNILNLMLDYLKASLSVIVLIERPLVMLLWHFHP